MSTTQPKKRSTKQAYLAAYTDAMAALFAASDFIHQLPAPDSTLTWDDVGEMQRVARLLEEIQPEK